MAKLTNTLILSMLILAMAALSGAEENSPTESARELMSPLPPERRFKAWEVSLDGSWLPDSDSPDAGGSVGMSEYRIKVGRSFRANSSLSFTPEIVYSLLQVSAPSSARLPSDLHSVSAGFRTDYRADSRLALSFLFAPGLAGDFREVGTDDIRVRLGATARYSRSDRLIILGGLMYQQGYKSLPVFPIVGAIYRPDRKWTITVAAPRTGVSFAPGEDMTFALNAEMTRREYQLHEERLGAEVVRYRDFRIEGAGDFTLFAPLKLEIAGGYAFSRNFTFYDAFAPRPKSIDLDSGPFARARVKMEW